MPAPVFIGQSAQQTDIGGRKRVRLAQLAQRDILRRPFPDASDRAQAAHGVLKPAGRVEEVRIGQGGGGHGRKCRCPAAWNAK